jgi:hypothetical protein
VTTEDFGIIYRNYLCLLFKELLLKIILCFILFFSVFSSASLMRDQRESSIWLCMFFLKNAGKTLRRFEMPRNNFGT